MKLVLMFVTGILFGYGVSQLRAPEPKVEQVVVEVPDSSAQQIKDKLQVLTDIEIEDYYRLKTMEERYQKADEILGKIVLLLLKDIGLRISENAQKEISQPRSFDRPKAMRPLTQTEDDLPIRKIPNNWVQFEKKLADIRSPMQAGEFLNEVKIENFQNEMSKSSGFSNKNNNFSELTGRFRGVAQVYENNKNKTWDVEIEIQGEFEYSNLRGNMTIMLSENGKVFSTSRDRGSIKNLGEFQGDSQAVYIRASPKVSFQVYYIKSLDSLIGNVYKSDGIRSAYSRIGTLELKRL